MKKQYVARTSKIDRYDHYIKNLARGLPISPASPVAPLSDSFDLFRFGGRGLLSVLGLAVTVLNIYQ